ncbi:hypothetical protein Cyan10605_2358 [Cyanobacterium aponinum PCC 10605]|uniref:Uncharacterized protein n=1 Tax=Cyanobacterium aponinum (strain PCC 10605) TaxID=755178 RepID=K9Z5I0_CYAAP|nr:hypothetical protein Cyan10605_2358 [Cyanobacterium aponinum PCC 10605]
MRDNYDFSQGVKNPYFDCLKTRSKKHMNLKSLFQNEKTRIILGDAITLLNEYIEDESISYLSILLIISAKNSPNFQDRREDEGNYIL